MDGHLWTPAISTGKVARKIDQQAKVARKLQLSDGAFGVASNESPCHHLSPNALYPVRMILSSISFKLVRRTPYSTPRSRTFEFV